LVRLILLLVVLLSPQVHAGPARGKATVSARPQTRSLHRQAPRAPRPKPRRRGRLTRQRPPIPVANLAPRGKTELERELQDRLSEILRTRWLARAQNGVLVLDTRAGDLLFAHNPDRQLNPASNVKLVSTLAALDALGADFLYTTRLLGPAPDAHGVVAGDVHVVGTGDPTLRPLHLWELAESLRQRGIHRIHGDLVVGPDDERDALAQPMVTITVVGGTAEGELPSVTIEPDSAWFVVDTTATTTSKGRRARLGIALETVASERPHVVVAVTGTIRPSQTVRTWREAPRPSVFSAHTLRAYLLFAGIEVSGQVRVTSEPARPDLPELAAHQSVSFAVLAGMVNKPSSNFLADRMISTAGGAVYGGPPSIAKGVRAMEAFLSRLGIASKGYLLENGSGLSRKNRLSARQIAQVLVAGAEHAKIGPEYLASLAIAGHDGTLRARFSGRASAGWMRGKTGTLRSVLALSGFVSVGGDDTLCFAILTNGFRDKRKLVVRAEHAAMVDAMYRYLRRRREREAPTTQPTEESIPPGETAPSLDETPADDNEEPAKDTGPTPSP
jgi:D-alanyl-D-alanine carboxypeptidase/D-alanyl-D-alanine-endopeptidase (penicillin-binding protein 4)